MLESQAQNEAPNTAAAWFLWTFTTLDPQTAVAYAKRAVECKPEYKLAWERLTHLYVLTGEHEDALAAAQKLMDLGADPYIWACFQGRVLVKLARFAEAVDQYSKAIAFFA